MEPMLTVLSSLQCSWPHIHLCEYGRKSKEDEITWGRPTSWLKTWRSTIPSYASYLLQSAVRPDDRDMPPSQKGCAEGCRLQKPTLSLARTDCKVTCSVCRVTASCKVSAGSWRWVQRSGDGDGGAGGVPSYCLLQGSCLSACSQS